MRQNNSDVIFDYVTVTLAGSNKLRTDACLGYQTSLCTSFDCHTFFYIILPEFKTVHQVHQTGASDPEFSSWLQQAIGMRDTWYNRYIMKL